MGENRAYETTPSGSLAPSRFPSFETTSEELWGLETTTADFRLATSRFGAATSNTQRRDLCETNGGGDSCDFEFEFWVLVPGLKGRRS